MPDFSKDNSRIDRLRRGLYSRKTPDIIESHKDNHAYVSDQSEDISNSWNKTDDNKFDKMVSQVSHVAEKHHGFARKLFSVSLIFFLIASVIFALVFFGGFNTISSQNVDIKVVGPVAVAAGQETTIDIVVLNENATDLKSAKLTVDYPEGVRHSDNASEELVSDSFVLGDIESGSQLTESLNLIVFGEKEEVKNFVITVEYRVDNSNGLFYKEKNHQISISSSPVIITPTYPREVNSGQDITLSVEVVSNSSEDISDFLVNVDYPFGFSFLEASPSPSFGDNVWSISNLKSGEKKTINIEGTITGQDNEERIFRIDAGTASSLDEREIGVFFSSVDEGILIKKPFIGLDVILGNQSGDFISSGIGTVEGAIRIRNNLPERMFNVVVESELSGNAFSSTGVTAGQNGFFRSIDNTILWDKRALPILGDMGPGEGDELTFRFNTLGFQTIQGGTPEVKVKVRATGERILESGSVERVESVGERTVRLATALRLLPRLVRSLGNIENSGPIPPRPNEETTYTVIWSLSNSFNTADSVVARATLPSYIEWNNIYSPQSESITFNPTTNEIVWNVGQVGAGTGYSSSPREVMFQISFLPSTSQSGTEPTLVGPVSVSGIDRVTDISVQTTGSSLDSKFTSDPNYKQGDGRVTN